MNFIWFFFPMFLQTLVWVPVRLAFLVFCRFTIRGVREYLTDLPRGVILAVNHSSELDPIIVAAALPLFSRHAPMFYTSRERKFYARSGWRQHFYGGLFFKLWGAHPVVTGLENYEAALTAHLAIVAAGGTLCIFPEGQKTRDGLIGEGKGGAAYIAWKTGAPIFPVRISGTFRMTFADFVRRRRSVSITFGAPFIKEALFERKEELQITDSHDDCKIAMVKVMEAMRHLA